MGWDHMVSEVSAEKFVFRSRTGPLCPGECSKIQLSGHRKKTGGVPLELMETLSTLLPNLCTWDQHRLVKGGYSRLYSFMCHNRMMMRETL